MRVYYYYASSEMERFNEPQEEAICNCQLTEEMIRKVVSQCAAGDPPFKALIPRFVAWKFCTWNVPKNLIDIRIVPGKPETDISPFDTAQILFEDCVVQIICRRVIPYIFEVFEFGEVTA